MKKPFLIFLWAVAITAILWYGNIVLFSTQEKSEPQQKVVVEIESPKQAAAKAKAKIEQMEKVQLEKIRQKEAKQEAQRRKELQLREMDNRVGELLTTGAIYSINIDFNEVRINPSIWLRMNINEKRGIVLYFSAYFDAKGSTGRVTVLSSRNDTKLASYGSWGGLKIYY